MPTIDPIRLAHFMVLPGAAELVEAFASLPPGEVRDSAVSHVQVLARACGWTPEPFRMEPQVARVVPSEPRRLTSPYAEGLRAQSPEGQIVERALRGEGVHTIAADLGVKLIIVTRTLEKARKEGGVVFPGDGNPGKGKAAKKRVAGARYNAAGRRIAEPWPVPPPPYWWEDPNSPVWEDPTSLPPQVAKAPPGPAGFGPLDRRSYATTLNAAKRKGHTMRDHMAQRWDILRRINAGETPTEVALALGIVPYSVYGLLSAIGQSRMTMAVAAQREAEERAASEPEPPPTPPHQEEPESPSVAAPGPPEASAEIPPTPEHRQASAHAARELAAHKWGFVSVEAYDHTRLRVRHLRMQGMAPALIAQRIGQPHKFVKNALDFWRDTGVQWPPIDINAQPQETAAA